MSCPSSLTLLARPSVAAHVVRRSYTSSSSVCSVHHQATSKAINSVHTYGAPVRRGVAGCEQIAKREVCSNSNSHHQASSATASTASSPTILCHLKNYLSQTEKALGKVTYF